MVVGVYLLRLTMHGYLLLLLLLLLFGVLTFRFLLMRAVSTFPDNTTVTSFIGFVGAWTALLHVTDSRFLPYYM